MFCNVRPFAKSMNCSNSWCSDIIPLSCLQYLVHFKGLWRWCFIISSCCTARKGWPNNLLHNIMWSDILLLQSFNYFIKCTKCILILTVFKLLILRQSILYPSVCPILSVTSSFTQIISATWAISRSVFWVEQFIFCTNSWCLWLPKLLLTKRFPISDLSMKTLFW